MSITRWSPFGELDELIKSYNKLRHSIKREPANTSNGEWLPALDITETPQSFVIKVEVPGIKNEHLQINVEQNVIRINGERPFEYKDVKEHRIERKFGTFSRSFSLPNNVDEENIHAQLNDGLLCLTLLKVEEAQHNTIEIKVNEKVSS
ncbi:Spore protein SP21 [invertebrate metagenome]|uniref:Spore protein SP21 n=1 Tax=invertebrate metagenome TaxID=1711999 RepID=A0A2H9TAJ3_9ZZZZ